MNKITTEIYKDVLSMRTLNNGEYEFLDAPGLVSYLNSNNVPVERFVSMGVCSDLFDQLEITEANDWKGVLIDVDPEWFSLSRVSSTIDILRSHNSGYANLGNHYVIVAPDEDTANLLRLAL